MKNNLISKSFIAYVHVNKINGKKYVGITSQPFRKRCRLDGSGYKQNPIFYNAIKKYGWDNFQHIIIFKNLDFKNAQRYEKILISLFKSNESEFGYNSQSGGINSFSLNEQVKKNISNTLKGRKFSKEHREKIGRAQLGKLNHRYGKKISQKQKDAIALSSRKRCSVKVNQYTKQGEFIKTWDSMSQIEKELGILHCCISDCCRGKQKSAGGFIWKYYR